MRLEGLICCLLRILSEYGNMKVFVTTENETQGYDAAQLGVSDIDNEWVLKIEGKTLDDEDEDDYEDFE